jgi:4'-phosphopantetheinyl transferase
MKPRLRWEPAPIGADLAAGEVHVWGAGLDELGTDGMLSLLSGDERSRADRFHFTRDRQRFVAARGLLRRLLGHYLDRDPCELRFAYGPRCKPSLPGLRFNVSHSGGLGLLAFSRDHEVGVDIECERSVPEAESIARRYFSVREVAELGGLSETERLRAFFLCWTRKEAFIKATGDGLSQPLDAFDVTLAPGEPARLLRIEGKDDEARRWWLEDLEPAAGFAAALAVERRPERIACWRWAEPKERGTRVSGEPRVLDPAGRPQGPARLTGRARDGETGSERPRLERHRTATVESAG